MVKPLMLDSSLLGRDLPLASIDALAAIPPAAMALARSVRSSLAMLTAPSTLSSPAPCCSRLAPVIGCAVNCRMALINGGVRPGLACSISATAPVTAGAATEVPDRYLSAWLIDCLVPPSPLTRLGLFAAKASKVSLTVAAAPNSLLPGATRSGLRMLSMRFTPNASTKLPRVGPRELKPLTTSSLRVTLASGLADPTVITVGSLPGDEMLP